jgi:hypothetical protein
MLHAVWSSQRMQWPIGALEPEFVEARIVYGKTAPLPNLFALEAHL